VSEQLRVWRVPYSTNVERVALALAHKGLSADWVDVDVDDRAGVLAVSGQELVPVLEAGDGTVIADSMAIIAWLEERVPEPALWPADRARRAETEIFIAWFNHVWKVPPNAIDAELATAAPDAARIAAWSAEIAGWLPWFEALLRDRPFLLGTTLGAADVCAFPFLKYGTLPAAPDDDEIFHAVLAEHLALDGRFPQLAAWIERVDALPQT
jgi:maleylpyruvate isomerase